MKKLTRVLALLLSVVILFSACSSSKTISADINVDEWNTNYSYVFVHGLSGWGSYDKQNKFLKYWGMFGGDLLKKLDKQGFNCYSASVNPQGSAWDRACELYAQLTGTVVDYGVAHSERCNHDRFGKDFTGNALIPSWSSEDKINLLGHSFGGATIRVLSQLMAEGDADEINATSGDDISPLFTGDKGDWIYSMVALAAPHNGTSAYYADDGSVEDELTYKQKFMSDMVSKNTAPNTDGRTEEDYAAFDLKIDNAIALNEKIKTFDNIYYFSIPCSSTYKDGDVYRPNLDITETTFVKSALKMGKFTGETDSGFVVDEEWLENDGLVNVISAKAPFNAPSVEYDPANINMGVWNILPTFEGDHMSLQGGLFKTNDMLEYYIELLNVINNL